MSTYTALIIATVSIVVNLCLAFVLVETKRKLSVAKSSIRSREEALDAANHVISEFLAKNTELEKEIEEDQERMRLYGEALDAVIAKYEQIKRKMADYEAAISLAIRQLEHSHDNEFVVSVDIRNEFNETTHFSEAVYYSAEAAAKAYMTYVAQYGEEFVSIT